MQITATLKKTEGANYPRNICIVAFISINNQPNFLTNMFIIHMRGKGRRKNVSIKIFWIGWLNLLGGNDQIFE